MCEGHTEKKQGGDATRARSTKRCGCVSGAIDAASPTLRRSLNFCSSPFRASPLSPPTTLLSRRRSLVATKASMSRLPQFSRLSTDACNDVTKARRCSDSSFQLINVSCSPREIIITEAGIRTEGETAHISVYVSRRIGRNTFKRARAGFLHSALCETPIWIRRRVEQNTDPLHATSHAR